MSQLHRSFPSSWPHTACLNVRTLKTRVGDVVQFDTAAQHEIGKRDANGFILLMQTR